MTTLAEAFEAGALAHGNGVLLVDNPFPAGSPLARLWRDGWVSDDEREYHNQEVSPVYTRGD